MHRSLIPRSSLNASRPDTLLIHLGGLGDVCLSESTFLSLARHFGTGLSALGYPRFLNLFQSYFSVVANADGREWLHLFSAQGTGERWKQIVFVGKDRHGNFRERLQAFSAEPIIFVDMYPDRRPVYVETYQLSQIADLGIKPVRREPDEMGNNRVVIYPERERVKRKWPVKRFIELYERLTGEGAEAVLLEPIDLNLPVAGRVRIEDLTLLASFLGEGGLFVSNDCGVAHLAAARGMRTVTLFYDHDPLVWRPRGRSTTVVCRENDPTPEEVYAMIRASMKKSPGNP